MSGSPKVLISADMEGISGIVHVSQTNPGRYDYERGRALMTADVNAVVAGILAASPSAAALVADAHGPFRNLLPEDLDRRVGLVSGKPRPLAMMAGLDDDTDVVFFVGYHGRAGTGPGVLAHTMSSVVLDVRVNGQAVGEIGLNAMLAGHHGAAVVFLSGDDTACLELQQLVPGAVTVPVKRALAQFAGELLHPAEARERLTRAAGEALQLPNRPEPLTISGPVEVEVDLYVPHLVDLATLIPGVRRAGGARTVAFTGRDFAEAYRLIRLLVELGNIDYS
jgi:D-amino peptidase